MPSDLTSQFLVQIISTKDNIRSKNLNSKLTEMGLGFAISPGVVPNDIDFQAGLIHSASLSKLLCQRNMSLGEVGCAMAHKNAMTNFLNSDHKFGVIFEDDAEIIADFDFDVVIKLLDSNVPKTIALGWIPGFAIAKDPMDPLSEEPIELITSPTCAFAYAINRSAARLMVDSQEKIIDVADWPIYTLNKVKFYSIHPNSPWVTANHDPKFSIIGERSTPIRSNTRSVLVSRIRLVRSVFTLLLLSITNQINASPKQIIHRLLVRDLLYRYGTSQVNVDTIGNNVIPLPSKFRRLLDLLKLS